MGGSMFLRTCLSWLVALAIVMGFDAPLPVQSDTDVRVYLPEVMNPERPILFSSNRTGSYQIYSWIPGAPEVVQLTAEPGGAYAPALSPDEQTIAFSSMRDGHFEVYTVAANGGAAIRLTYSASWAGCASWSPDGQYLLICSAEAGNTDIYRIDRTGANLTPLTNDPSEEYDPAWSPDGQTIAFESDRSGNYDIYLMAADGQNQRALTTSLLDEYGPDWAPDGSRLLFVQPAAASVVAVNVDGTGLATLQSTATVVSSAAWSPTGNRIVMTNLIWYHPPLDTLYVKDMLDGRSFTVPVDPNTLVDCITPDW